eukprot:10736731-Heterocapsa_arctica.AAC.1
MCIRDRYQIQQQREAQQAAPQQMAAMSPNIIQQGQGNFQKGKGYQHGKGNYQQGQQWSQMATGSAQGTNYNQWY